MKSYKSHEYILEPKSNNHARNLQRLITLEREIETLQSFEYTKKLMNLQLYIKKNYDEYIRLQNQIFNMQQKKNNKNSNSTLIKSKSKSSYQPNKTTDNQFQQIQKRNQSLQTQINNLKQKNAILSQPIQPISEQKKQKINMLQNQINELSKQVNILSDKKKAFSQAMNKPNMFQEYQHMIRECGVWRKANYQLTQQLKSIIMQLNQLTGKDDNPNLILINLK